MAEGGGAGSRVVEHAPDTVPRALGVSRPTGLRVLGLAVLALWATWAVLTWLSAPRFVTDEQLHADLAAGRIQTWRLATELHPERDWPPGAAGSWSFGTLAQRETDGLPADWDRRPVEAVVYWVDGDVAPVRFAGALPGGDPLALVSELRQAGATQTAPVTFQPPDRDRGAAWGLAAFALGLLVVLGNTRPTRGTRWFWFWLQWVPLGLGTVAYAVVELVLPGGPPRVWGLRGGSRRRRLLGWEGLFLLLASFLLVAGAASVLRDVAGPFLVPGR
jgi:hypothetical protein